MIKEALLILADQLNRYIVNNGQPVVETRNISALDFGEDGATGDFNGKVVLTLVNIAEEASLRNGPDFRVKDNNEVEYRNWPVHLNLYLLFSCPSDKAQKLYQNSVDRLARVVEFFQANREINFSEIALPGELLDRTDLNKLCLSMDLHTLNFEQINDLWGSLGGRQHPFVMYKARLVQLEMQRPQGEGKAIQQISQTLKHLRQS